MVDIPNQERVIIINHESFERSQWVFPSRTYVVKQTIRHKAYGKPTSSMFVLQVHFRLFIYKMKCIMNNNYIGIMAVSCDNMCFYT